MPWTSAVPAASSIEITPLRPETSSPGASVDARGRKRLEVFLARRTGRPAGMASYDAFRRATAASWAASPVSTDGNLLRGGRQRRTGPVEQRGVDRTRATVQPGPDQGRRLLELPGSGPALD